MALGVPTQLLAAYQSADQNAYTTASVSTVLARGYILKVITPNTSSVTPVKPTVTGAGETWTEFTDWLYDNTGGDRTRITFFTINTALGGTGALTIDYGGVTQDGCMYFLSEWTGHDVTALLHPTNIVKIGGNTSVLTLSGTLAALQQTANAALGCFCHQANEGSTVGSGFTALSSVAGTNPVRSGKVEYQLNVTVVDASWVTSSPAGLVAVEVQAAAGGASPVNTVAPAVTGTPRRTYTQTTDNGTWTNVPTSFAYQWQRDVAGNGVYSNIGGATASTYVAVAADVGCHVRCNVTATNAAGSTVAPSNAVGLVGSFIAGVPRDNGIELCTDGISVTLVAGSVTGVLFGGMFFGS